MQKKYINHIVCIQVKVFDREINYKLILVLKLVKDNFEVCLGIKSDINKFCISRHPKLEIYTEDNFKMLEIMQYFDPSKNSLLVVLQKFYNHAI